MRKYCIAIVGATGMVGLELLKILAERKFPVRELRLFASKGSAGKSVKFKNSRLKVQKIDNNSFDGVDLAFFAVDGSVSSKWVPVALKSGAVVIDKSSVFRMARNVPLVIPEINAGIISPDHRLIASPNCSTTPLAMVLKPLNDYAKVKRVVVSTYQSVSGAGLKTVQEMERQARYLIARSTLGVYPAKGGALCSTRPFPFAFNAIPQIDSFGDDDYTGEEVKIIDETHKILNDYSIKITATCVRIPVYCGHSESVNIETVRPMTVSMVRNLLRRSRGIKVMDNPAKGIYPMPIEEAGKDDVFVGRIRKDRSVKNGINLWLVCDNIRKGAALNAVQIAEYLIKQIS